MCVDSYERSVSPRRIEEIFEQAKKVRYCVLVLYIICLFIFIVISYYFLYMCVVCIVCRCVCFCSRSTRCACACSLYPFCVSLPILPLLNGGLLLISIVFQELVPLIERIKAKPVPDVSWLLGAPHQYDIDKQKIFSFALAKELGFDMV